jgi:hypothetical protein
VEFVSGSTAINEGGVASLSVRRVGGSLGPISVSYATIADSATGADFDSETGVLTWADGDTADKVITIDTISDGTTEPDEFFSVQLGTAIGGTSLGNTGIASVVINDLTPREAWRLSNFGDSANAGPGADGADFDLDGVTNLMEYGLGRSPASGIGNDGREGLPVVTGQAMDPLLAGRLTLVCNLPDPAPADVDYLVEVTSSLANDGWVTLATKSGADPWIWEGGGVARIVESALDGRSTVSVADTELEGTSPERFIRLGVVPR